MKKMILMCSITCAGQLYGMENIYSKPNPLAGVPTEVIMTIAQSNNNLDEAIENIINLSRVNKELNQMININDLKGFTKIVHILANQFDTGTIQVAAEFNTAIAKKYLNLYGNYIKDSHNAEKLRQLIKDGLDVNLTGAPFGKRTSLLMYVVNIIQEPEIVQLLLDAGANPYYKDEDGDIALDLAKDQVENAKNAKDDLESVQKDRARRHLGPVSQLREKENDLKIIQKYDHAIIIKKMLEEAMKK